MSTDERPSAGKGDPGRASQLSSSLKRAILQGLVDAALFTAPGIISPQISSAMSLALVQSIFPVRGTRAGVTGTSPVEVLDRVREDLTAALKSIDQVKAEAADNAKQVKDLQEKIVQLTEDKDLLDQVVKAKQRTLDGMVRRTLTRGRARGWLEGLAIGVISSAAVAFGYDALRGDAGSPGPTPSGQVEPGTPPTGGMPPR